MIDNVIKLRYYLGGIMENTLKCGLCGEMKELKLSHIIPKFVFRYLKKDSFTGRMRNLSNINVPVQDGDKQYLLCGSCEGLFSRNETKFANEIHFPFKENGFQSFTYDGDWLKYFITSVNWRTLYLDLIGFERQEDPDNNVNEAQLKLLKDAERSMRLYLLGEKKVLDLVESHIFFFDDVKSIGENVVPANPHSIMQGGAFDYTLITKPNGIYVFANLVGIMVVTIIKKQPKERWKNTFVKSEAGKIKAPQFSNSPVLSEMFYINDKRNEAFAKMSRKQADGIKRKVENNIEGFRESGTFKRILKDKNIKLKRDY